MAVGVRRTTLTDVARRAGVSRMTVYRRFPDVAALLQALMTREFGALVVETAGGPVDRVTARERFVDAVVAGARAAGLRLPLPAHPGRRPGAHPPLRRPALRRLPARRPRRPRRPDRPSRRRLVPRRRPARARRDRRAAAPRLGRRRARRAAAGRPPRRAGADRHHPRPRTRTMSTTTLDAARRARDLVALADGATVDVLVVGRWDHRGRRRARCRASRGLTVALARARRSGAGHEPLELEARARRAALPRARATSASRGSPRPSAAMLMRPSPRRT